jgi:hypothetical protein
MIALALTFSMACAQVAWPTVDTHANANGEATTTTSKIGANDAAIIAGVSKPFVLPEVQGAAENASSWFTWLTRARGVPLQHAHLLRDGDVTRERLLAAAEKARSEVGPGGTMWIIFIGHGAPSAQRDDGVLLGVDAQRTEHSLRERGVTQRELLEAARGKQASTIAIFDACFSGMASDGKTPLVPGSQATLPVHKSDAPAGTLILSSSEEVAGPLPGHDRPAFSYLLLGAVRGWGDKNDDGRVTVAEAYGYTKQALTALVTDKVQVPTVRGAPSSLDVVVSDPARERGPDLIELAANARAVGSAVPPRIEVPHTSSAAEDLFHEREITFSFDRKWLRRDRPDPLTRRDLLHAGKELAPEAAAVVEDITDRQALLTNPLVWVIPPIAGAGIGALGGLGLAAVLPEDAKVYGYAIGIPVGAVLMAGAGTIAVSLPMGLSGLLSDEDKHNLENAEHDLAEAINAAERKKLGLSPPGT